MDNVEGICEMILTWVILTLPYAEIFLQHYHELLGKASGPVVYKAERSGKRFWPSRSVSFSQAFLGRIFRMDNVKLQ